MSETITSDPRNFAYSDEQRQVLQQCLGGHSETQTIISNLEQSACYYRSAQIFTRGKLGALVRRDAKHLIDGCKGIISGLAGLKSTGSMDALHLTEDEMATLIGLTLKVRKHAHTIATLNPLLGLEKDSSERKPARRMLVEGAYILWKLYAFGDDASRLLSFIEASVRPVLIWGDRIGVGQSGRNVLQKDLDKIRREGVKFPNMLLIAGLTPKEIEALN